MRRFAWMLSALLLWGCAVSAPEPAASASPVPASDPIAIVVEAPVTEAPSTPIPTPTDAPTPEPTDTPEPTATPHPYRAEPVTVYERNAEFWYCPLNDAMQQRIVGSTYPEDPKDAPVKLSDLRYVSLRYVDFEGAEHTGELVVHHTVADEVLDIFCRLFEARYPLTSVRLLDDFGEKFDDNLSMAADNTSAYCCRPVTGSKKFSRHAYGVAIDVNPMRNPYIRPDKTFAPPNGERYLDRTLGEPGMIDEEDLCYRLFTEHGWSWGGHFKGEKDYQHFSKPIP